MRRRTVIIAASVLLLAAALILPLMLLSPFAYPLSKAASGAALLRQHRSEDGDDAAALAHGAKARGVPRILWVTHYDLSSIPPYIHADWRKHAGNYELRLFDDAAILEYLEAHFDPAVAQRFRDIPSGAHKADLFRFAALYREGGVYLDVKTRLVRPLEDVVGDAELMMTKGDDPAWMRGSAPGWLTGCHIGLLAAAPRHPVLAACLATVTRAPHVILTTGAIKNVYYLWNCVIAWRALDDYVREHPRRPVLVLSEVCEDKWCEVSGGKDRYGKCCVTLHPNTEELQFLNRDPAYPWK